MSIQAPAAPGTRPGEPWPELEAALRVAHAGARTRGSPALASAVTPVEARDLVGLFEAAARTGLDAAVFLRPDHRFGLLALGAAWSVEASGAQRFATVERAWSELLGSASLPGGPHPRGSGPLLVGGFGFATEAAVSEVWRGFEAARLVLPERLVTSTPGGTWLTSSWLIEPTSRVDGLVERTRDGWASLAAAAAAAAAAGPSGEAPLEGLRLVASRPGQAGWRDSVARLAGAVGRGRLDKAVLARQVELVASGPLEVPLVLRRLVAGAPESTVFAVSRGGRTFLGATPERLVSRRGRELRTVAMAGSARRGPDPAGDARLAEELLASDKEREEHAVVVDMLRETLAPLTDRLDIAPQPAIVRLAHLQHLVTPVAGRLREAVSVVRLAGLLHPSPAVAGAPRDLALELLAEEEPFERGWYAGPLGWMDRHGDGDLVVALRSGVVADRRATLLAGCGIMADSDPDREWLEAEAKLQALVTALGGLET